ncbi:MAG: nuclear transport factor 2 family protein [Solirubrobacteraceae bacterium]
MSSANLDLVRSIYAAWERGDFSSVEWAHAEIECVSNEPLIPLDATGVAELGKVWGNWLRAWNGFHIDADGCREVDVERVLTLLHYGGRDRLAGQEVMPTEAALLFHIRDGKVARLIIYWDCNLAFADLGLTPEDDS